MSNIAVRLDDVSFSYERDKVLKNLTADIEENRICFIMGNNGSGKTTLIKNIMGFLRPQSGKIMIKGRNVSTIDNHAMSKIVSYVPQAIRLNTDFKVIDYLALGRTPHSGLLNRLNDSDYDIIDKYINRFEIGDSLEIEFNKLSGGQKQMIAIVRSLIQETPIIVLDEPMSALDMGKQAELLKVFNELINEEKTVIMTTHNPNHALSISCDVCFLKYGEIVAFGRNEEIIDETILHKIYGKNITLDHGKFASVVFDTGSS